MYWFMALPRMLFAQETLYSLAIFTSVVPLLPMNGMCQVMGCCEPKPQRPQSLTATMMPPRRTALPSIYRAATHSVLVPRKPLLGYASAYAWLVAGLKMSLLPCEKLIFPSECGSSSNGHEWDISR